MHIIESQLHVLISAPFALAVSGAMASSLSTDRLASCVGPQFVQLQQAPRKDRATNRAATPCLANQDISVCRDLLAGDEQAGHTMRVTVSIRGAIVQEWVESADPAYRHRVQAFMERGGHQGASPQSTIVIATLQSESQGMGVQEWLVNVIDRAGRRTFATSEFGRMGSLVFDRTQRKPLCKLLLTQWESRKTPTGERLFLVGKLVELNANEKQYRATASTMFTRLDQRLQKLRAEEPASRPLHYFARPAQ